MTNRSLTVGTIQVTAVCDVTGDFPDPLERAFPQVAAAAWAPWRRRHPEAFSGDDRWRLRDWCFEAFDRCAAPLQALGVAELLDGDRALDAQLSVLHTPGSQSLLVRSGEDALLLWGDVANHPAQVGEPDWGPGSDVQPEVAAGTRRRLLHRVEGEGMWLGTAHFPEPFGTVTRVEGGRRWIGRS
jgi:glyoxylase-like metal-dependent hydrolase (beta-lactamase superfamily II)